MAHQTWRHARRAVVVGLLAGGLLVADPVTSGATTYREQVRTPAAKAAGETYGGTTAQGMPVVVELTAARRKVVRAVIALSLTCTSGSEVVTPDRYSRLPVTRSGRFRVSFGPVTQRNDDGTTSDYRGSMSGRLNAARTKMTGTWRFQAVDYDATGAVTDTCSSGAVAWSAKQ